MPADLPKRRALRAAACLGVGITIARFAPPVSPLAWFLLAMLMLGVGIVSRGRSATALLAAATILIGGGWYALRIQTVPADHIARRLTEQPSLITVEGMIVTAPRLIEERAGRLGRFMPASPRTHLELRVDRWFDNEGSAARVSGRLWLGADGDATNWPVGHRVRTTGMARAVAPPTNPGESDRRLWAAAGDIGGQLNIDAPGAITAASSAPNTAERIEASIRQRIEKLRANARAWLDNESHARSADRQPRALLRALLLGTHDRDMGELDDAFMRLGLTHILSISGLNLALLAGTMFFLLRFIGDRPRTEAVIAALAIIGYLLIIPVRAPVARSAIMVLSLLAGETAGRRYDRLTILGWAMIIVLLIQPLELFSPGFQLSFGVVAALMTLTHPVRARLFGERPQRDSHGTLRAAIELIKDAAASSLVAWAVASPLAAYHVGVFSPLGAIATVLLMPLVSVIMGAGYVALLATLAVPIIGEWAAPPLTAAAELLARLVFLIDAAPGTVVHLPRLSIAWTLLATAAVIWWLRPGGPTGIEGYSKPARLARWACTITTSAWLGVTLIAPSLTSSERMRLDTLDVSDGACHLLRIKQDAWHDEAVMFDCGSLRLTIGERTLPAAVRALGAWRVHTVFLSHPNVDHYSGLLDIVQPLGVRRVIIGECFQKAADRAPAGPVAFVLSELRRMGVEIRIVADGDFVEIAGARIEILSPPRGSTWKLDNDASLVCRITLPPRTPTVRSKTRRGEEGPIPPNATILFTGDIQREAIIALRERHPDLRPTILELPHHGSHNDASEDFVTAVNAPYIVQSTGPRRLNDPRWNDAREGRTWLTTAEVGAISITITPTGEFRVKEWKQ